LFYAGAGGAAVAAYFTAFAWCFEVLGSPARDNKHGWLGPRLRGDPHFVDIGKAWDYEGAGFSRYRTFRPMCQAWLWVNGL
jgi:hypothetical protein